MQKIKIEEPLGEISICYSKAWKEKIVLGFFMKRVNSLIVRDNGRWLNKDITHFNMGDTIEYNNMENPLLWRNKGFYKCM